MGSKQNVSSLVTGGAASAGPPLGPSLGPLGVNIMEVINAINDKTRDFEGMKVPVTVMVDTDTKQYEIDVGIPSVAPLIFKEAGIQKGSGASGTEWVGDITMDSLIKIARTKLEASYASSLKSVTKTIAGTCLAAGVKIESKTPGEITDEINQGLWDEKIDAAV
ncbi:MAG: 50S ribosomal protein L11 [Cenarchaeum sp. SB0665_bin_23]|nr:50S ribosomal protein L11 [Cenarchaeum sp. SB0665_bin_23]MYG33170.1 50S ribosomal protein L11 [Cenarchaeum sp. SB0677_bin_16]